MRGDPPGLAEPGVTQARVGAGGSQATENAGAGCVPAADPDVRQVNELVRAAPWWGLKNIPVRICQRTVLR